MAKNLTGFVSFDKKRKRWFFRCSPVDPKTGLRKEKKEFFLTQKEAEQGRRRFLTDFESRGEVVFSREDLTFEQLAERYQKVSPQLNGAIRSGAINGTWSADSRTFEYDLDGKRYRFDVASKAALIADGAIV